MAAVTTHSIPKVQTGLNPVRSFVVNGFILGYLLLTVSLFATGYEAWPFCTYWMYEGTYKRGDETGAIEYETVAGGREKWIDQQAGSVLAWDFAFDNVGQKYGWSNAKTRKFFADALEQIQSESRADDPQAPLPTAIRVYSSDYHFPDSGDYQPIRIRRTLLLEVTRDQP